MSDIEWTVTHQDTSIVPYRCGILSSGRWYGGRDDESDWSAWVDNNPPVVVKKSCADGHDWADTGLAKTWCKRCDVNGRWVLGRVEIEEKKL